MLNSNIFLSTDTLLEDDELQRNLTVRAL